MAAVMPTTKITSSRSQPHNYHRYFSTWNHRYLSILRFRLIYIRLILRSLFFKLYSWTSPISKVSQPAFLPDTVLRIWLFAACRSEGLEARGRRRTASSPTRAGSWGRPPEGWGRRSCRSWSPFWKNKSEAMTSLEALFIGEALFVLI